MACYDALSLLAVTSKHTTKYWDARMSEIVSVADISCFDSRVVTLLRYCNKCTPWHCNTDTPTFASRAVCWPSLFLQPCKLKAKLMGALLRYHMHQVHHFSVASPLSCDIILLFVFSLLFSLSQLDTLQVTMVNTLGGHNSKIVRYDDPHLVTLAHALTVCAVIGSCNSTSFCVILSLCVCVTCPATNSTICRL